MAIDGALLWGIIEKVAIAIAGYATAYLLEKRTKLVVYFGHVAAFRVTPPQQHPMAVHTHSLVLRNGGRSPATGVRIPHRVSLAPGENVHFAVEPNIPYSTTPLPGGGTEIKIDVLVPKQQVTVSYLYFPPLLFSQIHDQITCDQMIARVINVLPTYQFPRWASITTSFLLVVGSIATIYMLVIFVENAYPIIKAATSGGGK